MFTRQQIALAAALRIDGHPLMEIERRLGIPATRKGAGARDFLMAMDGKVLHQGQYIPIYSSNEVMVAPHGPTKTHKPAKGQGTLCRGKLTITLSGPQGCGKSIVVKILKSVLALTPIAEFQIVEVQTK